MPLRKWQKIQEMLWETFVNLSSAVKSIIDSGFTSPTKATTKATEATSKGCESDDIATEKAQKGTTNRNYQ